MEPDAIKFPKTPRLADVLAGDVHRTWRHLTAVVEEKIDGANVGIWIDGDQLRLQSRGHVLRGGAGEAQFAPLHAWAAERRDALHVALGSNRVLYGEWCFRKHRVFYDALPDWLLGFDVLDRRTGVFLPTVERDEVFQAARVHHAPRLHTCPFGKAPAFESFLGLSRLKTANWRSALIRTDGVLDGADDSDRMEGVYVRVESTAGVFARMKLHRAGFEKVPDTWDGPFVKNQRRLDEGRMNQ